MSTVVASCNLRFTLSDVAFDAGLRKVLAEKPDLVALQEAGPNRDRTIERIARDLGYGWTRPHSPNGDPTMPVLWLEDRYRLRACRAIRLARREFVGHLVGRKDRLPASWATEVVLDDLFRMMNATAKDSEQTVLIGFHLTAEVEMSGRYRRDPGHLLRVLRHRREKHRLGKRGRMHKRRGRRTFLVGDGNFAGLTVRGFVSCWKGRNGGTLGNRAVDICFAPVAARKLWTIETPSDHDALVVTYP